MHRVRGVTTRGTHTDEALEGHPVTARASTGWVTVENAKYKYINCGLLERKGHKNISIVGYCRESKKQIY